MKQCPECTKRKKADNCIQCYIEQRQKLQAISDIMKKPIHDYKKINEINKILGVLS